MVLTVMLIRPVITVYGS